MAILVLVLLVVSVACSAILIAACILSARVDRDASIPPTGHPDSQAHVQATNVLIQDMATVIVAEKRDMIKHRNAGHAEQEENTISPRIA